MSPKKRRRIPAKKRGLSRKADPASAEAAGRDVPSIWGAALVHALSSASEADADPGKAFLLVTQDALDHVDQALDAAEPPRPIVCGPGCPFCCHNQISVTPMEAFGLCAFLENTFEPAERDRLTKSLFHIRDLIRNKSRAELYDMRKDLACAFLINGSCGVYRARPVACRTWHSLDRAACEAAFHSPDPAAGFETYASRREYGEEVQVGLLRGASVLGLEAGYLVMTRALALLLERDWREEMSIWLAGGKVFSKPGRL